MFKKQRMAKTRGKRRGDFFSRSKVCRLCVDKIKSVDYKDVAQLQKFITEKGKIIPPRVSGTCTRHQRVLGLAIERARAIALLPFVKK